MLGVVSEQSPKGGALTLNAISGIGMLAVGTLGFPFIGKLMVDTENAAVVANATTHRCLPREGAVLLQLLRVIFP